MGNLKSLWKYLYIALMSIYIIYNIGNLILTCHVWLNLYMQLLQYSYDYELAIILYFFCDDCMLNNLTIFIVRVLLYSGTIQYMLTHY